MNFGFGCNMDKRQADRLLGMAACVLCCLILAGCRGTDRAIVLAGEPVGEEAGSAGSGAGLQESESVPGAGFGEAQTDSIFVHVCGAVKTPGVVRLPEGSRAWDALQAAGGLAAGASETSVNLAEVLQDGVQLYFPTEEEAAELRRQTQEAESGLVNINTADVALLCTLPGIGEARAADILAYREAHGGFQTPEEIMQVPGIKEGAYARIRDKITVR